MIDSLSFGLGGIFACHLYIFIIKFFEWKYKGKYKFVKT